MMRASLTPSAAQFRKELRAAMAAMKPKLVEASALAADWSSEQIRKRYNALHTRRSGAGVGSIRVLGNTAVAFGSQRAPYMLGQNFGSTRYKQFPARVDPDHFAFSVVRAGTPTIQKMYDAAIEDVMEEPFNG